MSQTKLPANRAELPFGINVAGYLGSEKGVGELARSGLRVMAAAMVPHVANNIIDTGSQNLEHLPPSLSIDNPYAINLITLNAEELVSFARTRPTYLKNRFNVAYWAWELSTLPREWTPAFEHLDEVWTISQFTRDSIAASSSVPVRVVPCSLDLSRKSELRFGRDEFQIPEDVYSFLFLFDFHSALERKNPIGLIEAFKNAFGSRKDVELLIKSSHSREHLDQLLMLQRAAAGANVRILDRILSREALRALMMASDCYVSLHRSEGFGLTIAEAMLCGKPTVATDYSGSCDFMSTETGFPVPFKLVDIEHDQGLYRAGQRWAQPDLNFAADVMRYIERNQVAAAEVGRRAKAHVSQVLHPVTIGKEVRRHLGELGYPEDIGKPRNGSQEE